mmetsp:Transcript_14647/g.23985  ORF Transcript_14647/g.23985 Transcript_14647/m.23985 type:complete len:699 (+) Transcript_14647:291-2387(+)
MPTSTNEDFNFTLTGSLDKWESLTSCDGIPMYNAGNRDSSKPNSFLVSHAWLNWDCSSGKLCILVKADTDSGYTLETSTDSDLWFKDYSDQNSPQVPVGSGGVTKIYDDDKLIAWEACYSMAAECSKEVEIHANFQGNEASGTTSTGKSTASGLIAFDLHCSCSCDNDDVCKINECYGNSVCEEKDTTDGNSKKGVCDFQISDPNCCIDGDDCGGSTVCVKPDSATTTDSGTGTCQASGPTPSPTPTGGGSVTPPTSSGAEDECTENGGECSKLVEYEECATVTCNLSTTDDDGNKCSALMPRNPDGSCVLDPPSGDEKNTCYDPKCVGTNCAVAYKPENSTCTVDDSLYSSDCVQYKCKPDLESTNGRTTCEAEKYAKFTQCGEAKESRGVCDLGDMCDGEGVCSKELSYSTDVCRESTAPCDKPEYCTGSSYDCPNDVNYGPEQECRPSCDDGNCLDDIAEVCDSNFKTCPDDIIFQQTLDLMAGQHYIAGNTAITATVLQGATRICVDINLIDGWELQLSDAAIKLEINNEAAPKSSPGSYVYKYVDLDDMASKGNCYVFDEGSIDVSCQIWFALHLDVVGAQGNTETAWAKLPSADTSGDGAVATTTTETSLVAQPFTKPGIKGPKTKGGNKSSTTTAESGEVDSVGWGNYFTFSICCANINKKELDTCKVIGGGSAATPLLTEDTTDGNSIFG